METKKLSIQSFSPEISNTNAQDEKFNNETFVGIDFGTSTTVVSLVVPGDKTTPVKTRTISIPQKFPDGRMYESHLVPSAIAWHNNELLVGKGALELKNKLTLGRNLWFSFKMDLGVDLGPQYYNTELASGHPVCTIESPKDAAAAFFSYLKFYIERYVADKNLPQRIRYSVSIPASFEANQRKDLYEALEGAGISMPKQTFIDEPNAAFLNYVAESYKNNFGTIYIPEDAPVNILVFDFGAGTCDISVLEISKGVSNYVSKNLSISKFEALGGDDIDRQIARNCLLPQLLEQNGCGLDDFKTVEIDKRILPRLLKIAERLKIRLCKTVASNMVDQTLPAISESFEHVALNTQIEIPLLKKVLKLTSPKISFNQFAKIMASFTKIASKGEGPIKKDAVISIFSPVETALKKADLNHGDIDIVLLVGGSSENPYIQNALYNYFSGSEIEIPYDLRSHVSMGAAINSFLLNGLGANIVQPITSESISVITKNNSSKLLILSGTQIPSKELKVGDLFTDMDNEQAQIQLPICVGNEDRILTVIRISPESNERFSPGTPVSLQCTVNEDKIINVKAVVNNIEQKTAFLNPYANTQISAAEKNILKAIKQANRQAVRNGGRPTVEALEQLYQAYYDAGEYLKAAEILTSMRSMDTSKNYGSMISLCYHKAGKNKLSKEWDLIAYQEYRSPENAFNLALSKMEHGAWSEFEQLMKESLKLNPKAYYTLDLYGAYLIENNNSLGHDMIIQAFDIMYSMFNNGTLPADDFSRLSNVARKLNKTDIVNRINQKKEQISQEPTLYDENMLVNTSDYKFLKINNK